MNQDADMSTKARRSSRCHPIPPAGRPKTSTPVEVKNHMDNILRTYEAGCVAPPALDPSLPFSNLRDFKLLNARGG